MAKLKIAIFDMTDCEGCELELIALREKLLKILENIEIVNWRLAQERNDTGPFDISFVEGTPMTPDERELLNEIRNRSKILIGLGACACLGGIPGIVHQQDRDKFVKKVYPSNYRAKATDAKPIDAYVNVDLYLQGCPVNPKEIERFISSLSIGKLPEVNSFPVCLECKLKGNLCYLVNKKPCLGPITMGGCGAICISNNKPCVGCFGLLKQVNFKSIIRILNNLVGNEETKNMLAMFLSNTKEFINF